MRFLFFIFLTTYVSLLSAQVAKITPYVITFSGDKFVGQHLTYESDGSKKTYFVLDDKMFDTPEVSYFQSNHGYFANLAKIHGDKSERYAIRIKAGNVNLFEEIEIEAYAKEELATGADGKESSNEMLATWKSFQYFSKSDGPVKKANFKNMKNDLGDNAISLREVKIYRNYRILQIAMVAIGAGIISYDISQQNGGAIRFNPLMATGIVVGGGSYFLGAARENSKWLAVDAYNN